MPYMQVVKGTVVDGKVVVDPGSIPEGTEVAVVVTRHEGSVCLPPQLLEALNDALDEAGREDGGISAEELFAELRKYG